MNKNKQVKKKHVKKCSECGMCKTVCPIYKVCLNEYKSPRGKAILMKAKIADDVFFDCTLCKACEEACPLNIDFNHIEARKQVIKAGKGPTVNKEMLENLKKYGTPFGKVEKGKKPKKLYCC